MSARARTALVLLTVFGGGTTSIACKSDGGGEPAPEPIICEPPGENPPSDLACTGLYSDFRANVISGEAKPYAPAGAFWSDGYEKARFLMLPEGTKIDATDVDDWTFPVGTKVWKEFRRGQRKIETRLFWKVKDDKWTYAAYEWSEDGKTALRGEGKQLTVDGLPYTIPALRECNDCHRGKKDKLLGVEALSLAQSGAQGLTLATLVAENRIAPPPARTTVSLPHPGLSVLHINCGVSCHNANPASVAYEGTLRMRLGFDEVATQPVTAWQLYSTTVGVRTDLPAFDSASRIAPGAPDKSSIISSMKMSGTGQMPPTRRDIDLEGVASVEAWITSLPPK